METFEILIEGRIDIDIGQLCRDLNSRSKRRFVPAGETVFPELYLNKFKSQYNAYKILQGIKPRTFIITDKGLYTEGVNYVIGMSYKNSSIISMDKLNVENNRPLSYNRLLNEIVHQLGYLSGLNKCPDPECVMAPSSHPRNIDKRTFNLCRSCAINVTIHGVEV